MRANRMIIATHAMTVMMVRVTNGEYSNRCAPIDLSSGRSADSEELLILLPVDLYTSSAIAKHNINTQSFINNNNGNRVYIADIQKRINFPFYNFYNHLNKRRS